MREPVPRSLITALMLLRRPALADVLRQRAALPDDITVVIRIAGGCQDTVGQIAAALGKPEAVLVKAARFYLEQVLFYSETDSYRILGLAPDAPQTLIREHGRWLMRWLHPDTDQSEWETAFSRRVASAWNDLKTPSRRAAYNRTQSATRSRAFHRGQPVDLAFSLIPTSSADNAPTPRPQPTLTAVAALGVFLIACLVPLNTEAPGSSIEAMCDATGGHISASCSMIAPLAKVDAPTPIAGEFGSIKGDQELPQRPVH